VIKVQLGGFIEEGFVEGGFIEGGFVEEFIVIYWKAIFIFVFFY
jgi:hypothetical protein